MFSPPDIWEALWGRGEEERHEDHPGAWPEGHGPAGDAGEGRRPRLLRHQQPTGDPYPDVPARIHRPPQSARPPILSTQDDLPSWVLSQDYLHPECSVRMASLPECSVRMTSYPECSVRVTIRFSAQSCRPPILSAYSGQLPILCVQWGWPAILGVQSGRHPIMTESSCGYRNAETRQYRTQ